MTEYFGQARRFQNKDVGQASKANRRKERHEKRGRLSGGERESGREGHTERRRHGGGAKTRGKGDFRGGEEAAAGGNARGEAGKGRMEEAKFGAWKAEIFLF
jgi:hypothetical protein